jgi:hypothetical protein
VSRPQPGEPDRRVHVKQVVIASNDFEHLVMRIQGSLDVLRNSGKNVLAVISVPGWTATIFYEVEVH